MAKSGLQELREQVMRRHRAAGQKVSRLRKRGLDVSGTDLDPRVNAKLVQRYNRRQLEKYAERLNSFTSRGFQPVGDSRGRVLPQSAWEEYKAAEREYNRRKREAFNKIKDIVIPNMGGTTVGQRQKIVTPDRPSAGNPSANPFMLRERKPNNFVSEDAMRKLTANLKDKLKGDFIAKEIERARAIAIKMAQDLGKDDYATSLIGMSQQKFNILWNFTPFADKLATPYRVLEADIVEKAKAWHMDILDDNLEEAGEWISEINNLKITEKPRRKK